VVLHTQSWPSQAIQQAFTHMTLMGGLHMLAPMDPLEVLLRLQLVPSTIPAGLKTAPALRSLFRAQTRLLELHIALMPILMVTLKNRASRALRAA